MHYILEQKGEKPYYSFMCLIMRVMISTGPERLVLRALVCVRNVEEFGMWAGEAKERCEQSSVGGSGGISRQNVHRNVASEDDTQEASDRSKDTISGH